MSTFEARTWDRIAMAARAGAGITLTPLEVRVISPRYRVTWQEVSAEQLVKTSCDEVDFQGVGLPTWHEARALVPGIPVAATRTESGVLLITYLAP